MPTCQKLKEWQKALDDKPEDDEIFSGFLYRRSNPANHDDGNLPNNSHKTGHLWKRRWFILKSDCCLCWYKQPNVRLRKKSQKTSFSISSTFISIKFTYRMASLLV